MATQQYLREVYRTISARQPAMATSFAEGGVCPRILQFIREATDAQKAPRAIAQAALDDATAQLARATQDYQSLLANSWAAAAVAAVATANGDNRVVIVVPPTEEIERLRAEVARRKREADDLWETFRISLREYTRILATCRSCRAAAI